VQRHWNDQIDVLEEAPFVSTQDATDPYAQERQPPEFQGVNHLDERWLIRPPGMKAQERGWVQPTRATEIAIGKRNGLQRSAAASAGRIGNRLEVEAAEAAKAELERARTLDSIAGHANGGEKQGKESKTSLVQLGPPGV
jgi:hypothetical protein